MGNIFNKKHKRTKPIIDIYSLQVDNIIYLLETEGIDITKYMNNWIIDLENGKFSNIDKCIIYVCSDKCRYYN